MKIEIEMTEILDYMKDILDTDNNIDVNNGMTIVIDDNNGKEMQPKDLSVVFYTIKEGKDDV